MTEEQIVLKKNLFLRTINDFVPDLFYYDRKNDDELSVEDIDYLVRSGHVTRQEMIDAFNEGLEEAFP